MKKFYLFDLDGTLIDSMRQWSQKMLLILERENIPYPEDIIQKITPLGDVKTAEYFFRLGVKKSVEEILAAMDAYAEEEYAHKIPLKPYVREYLMHLQHRGASLNVLTASPHKLTDVCLKRNSVWNCFENVWSTEDFGLAKSDPQIFHAVARKLCSSEEDILFFDDNLLALAAAKKAGLKTVGVFDASSLASEEEMKGYSDRYIHSFQELL